MACVEEDLACSVCRDLFSQSQPLPCGHSLCSSCVREAWIGCKRLTCPQCQDEPCEVPCDCCPLEAAKALAVKTCLRCEVSLCSQHLQPHLERPAFSSHLLVDPLNDLSLRRCPAHSEIYRYYCTDEQVYVCGDCLLSGAHAEHQVKALKHVEDDVKAILNVLLQTAEEKIQNAERILKEHENSDCTIIESLREDDAQVERMGSDLEAQVKALVLSLRDLTERQKQQIIERVHKDCTKVRQDVSQTQSIQEYLSVLQAETDPYLLIWAFQSDDTKLLSDLNSPPFRPDPISLDRKPVLEEIESKYRGFITSTLHCLSELKRELLTSPLTLDLNTAHPLLNVAEDLRSVSRMKKRLSCPPHPERFDHWPQVLTVQTVSSGTHYWELEAEGFWDIGVCYKSIGRKGKQSNAFGNNKLSWSLTQQHDRKLAAWHNRKKTRLMHQMTGNRIAVALDYSAGTITFSEVGTFGNLTHVHTFSASLTEPVCLGFGLYKVELKSRISIVKF
ncbi:E3 ubiquitin/ISG15 ligase TRIM25 [Eucyclogobius newberryi]|uniref:E3 ubiquitin/ISG15 ligase TRIM25 n=1 Tax=Eucyclogobius newberryi TaxID=166745 RepID=UPI003B5BA36A